MPSKPNSAFEVSTSPRPEGSDVGQSSEDKVSVQIDLLAPIPEKRRVFIEWKSLSAFVPTFFMPEGPLLKASKTLKRAVSMNKDDRAKKPGGPPPKRQILFDSSGFVRPGEISALLGPSGSGKTTLISIISGRASKMMTVTGTTSFNGCEMTKTIRRQIGYVAQDDLMFTDLTVYETLYYAALLRLPKFMTKEEKLGRVEAVISSLGLDKCRDTLIGGGFRKGVSGGERKRVSVGHELLINPSVLILDEPTSGLDSTTAMNLLCTLRDLSAGGRAVLTTIHQPSSRLYKMLDTVMVLSEGRTLYYGSSDLTVPWFTKQGYELPYTVNVAEFILDIANGDHEDQGRDGEESRVYLINCMADYLKSHPRGYVKAEEEEDINRHSTELTEFVPVDYESQNKPTNFLEPAKKGEKWGATFFEQIAILTSRAVRNRRFKSLSRQSIIQNILISIIGCILWWQKGEISSLQTASDMSSLIFFVMIYVNFSQLFKAIFTFPNVFNIMVKERISGMYRLSSFYIAETMCDLPMDYSVPMVFVISLYWCSHMRYSVAAFIGHVCIIIVSSLCIQTLGLLLGAGFRNPDTSTSVAAVIMICLMLTSGFWVRNVPSWVTWIKYVGPPYWAYRVLLQIEFGGRDFKDCGRIGEEQLPIELCKPLDSLEEELGLPFDFEGPKWVGIVVLFAMLFTLRVLCYYVLREKSKMRI